MIVCKTDTKDIEEIRFVINRSNGETYRKIIPREHFKESVSSKDELTEDLLFDPLELA
jgi:hypothetical protein